MGRMLYLIRFSFTLAPFVYFPALLISPCNSPPFFVSWLPDCNNSDASPSFLVTLAVGSVDMLLYGIVMQDIILHMSYINIQSMSCLLQYMQILDGNKKIGFTRQKLHFYNGILLLNKLISSRCTWRLFLPNMCAVWSIQIMGMYGLLVVSEHLEENPFMVVLAIVITVDLIIVSLIVTKLGGNVSTVSGALLDKWKKEEGTGNSKNYNRKLKRRQLNGLLLVSIRFGGKYMDKTTPFVVQDFCINQAVAISLMNNQ
jgi:hypothetical protein